MRSIRPCPSPALIAHVCVVLALLLALGASAQEPADARARAHAWGRWEASLPDQDSVERDLSGLTAPVVGRLFDPTHGRFAGTNEQPVVNRGSHPFTSPGKNSVGDGD